MNEAPVQPFPTHPGSTRPPGRDDAHENALPLLWRDARALLWVMVAGEFLAAILALSLDTPGVAGRFAVVSLGTQFVVLLTVLSLYLLRRRLRATSPSFAAYVAFGTMLGHTVLVAAVTRFVFAPIVALSTPEWQSLVWRSVAIVGIAGAMGLLTLQNHWRIKQLALQTKQAQLEALQARIQPHFLFNTLNTAIALVRSRPDRVEQLLLDLSDVFRAALAAPAVVSLSDELTLARRYLDIESTRLGDRLRLEWHEDADVTDVTVPGLSIQPLVENAVRHGVEPSIDGGRVAVSVQRTDAQVVVRIENEVPVGGRGLPGHNIGVRSARERIAALGAGARLETAIVDGRHVATVYLPIR